MPLNVTKTRTTIRRIETTLALREIEEAISAYVRKEDRTLADYDLTYGFEWNDGEIVCVVTGSTEKVTGAQEAADANGAGAPG